MKKMLRFSGIIACIGLISLLMMGCGSGNPILNSNAILGSDSTLGEVKLQGIHQSYGINEHDAPIVQAVISSSVQMNAKFVPVFDADSQGANVTAYLGSDKGRGKYEAIKAEGYDFSGINKILWVKVVSEDKDNTKFYEISVTVLP
jgi:hypothetical protein